MLAQIGDVPNRLQEPREAAIGVVRCISRRTQLLCHNEGLLRSIEKIIECVPCLVATTHTHATSSTINHPQGRLEAISARIR
jgi:hypothetical protein